MAPSLITFFVPGVPRALQRARTAYNRRDRRTGALVPLDRPRSYTPKTSEDFENLVYLEALAARPPRWEPLVGPVELSFVALMPCPKGREPGWSTLDPDLSNVLKAVEDALIGLAYEDDNQIASYGRVGKLCVQQPSGLYVCVESLAEVSWAERWGEVLTVEKP